MKIAYLPASNNGVSFRGTEVAMYGYMIYAKKMYNIEGILCIQRGVYNEQSMYNLFNRKFPILLFETEEDLEEKLLIERVDYLYTIRGFVEDGLLISKIPMLFHCVYKYKDERELPEKCHKESIIASVSESVMANSGFSIEENRDKIIPHIVYLDDGEGLKEEEDGDYREMLGIPENAIVFGRHGGFDSWDLEFARDVIVKILEEREDIYFLFSVRPNLLNFISHKRLICLDAFSSLEIKRKFLNTIDYFIHAQKLGETFGLSIGEASLFNKPVIVWKGGESKEHLRLLGDNCIKYEYPEELYSILSTATREDSKKFKANNLYLEHTPDKIMEKFKNVFKL